MVAKGVYDVSRIPVIRLSFHSRYNTNRNGLDISFVRVNYTDPEPEILLAIVAHAHIGYE